MPRLPIILYSVPQRHLSILLSRVPLDADCAAIPVGTGFVLASANALCLPLFLEPLFYRLAVKVRYSIVFAMNMR